MSSAGSVVASASPFVGSAPSRSGASVRVVGGVEPLRRDEVVGGGGLGAFRRGTVVDRRRVASHLRDVFRRRRRAGLAAAALVSASCFFLRSRSSFNSARRALADLTSAVASWSGPPRSARAAQHASHAALTLRSCEAAKLAMGASTRRVGRGEGRTIGSATGLVRARDGRRRRRGGSHPYSRRRRSPAGWSGAYLAADLALAGAALFEGHRALRRALLLGSEFARLALLRRPGMGEGTGRRFGDGCRASAAVVRAGRDAETRTSADSLGAADASSSFFFGLFFFRRSGGPLGPRTALSREGFTMRSLGRSECDLCPQGPRFVTFPDEPGKTAKSCRGGKLRDRSPRGRARARRLQRRSTRDDSDHRGLGDEEGRLPAGGSHITFDGASTILLLDPSRQSTHLNRRRREPLASGDALEPFLTAALHEFARAEFLPYFEFLMPISRARGAPPPPRLPTSGRASPNTARPAIRRGPTTSPVRRTPGGARVRSGQRRLRPASATTRRPAEHQATKNASGTQMAAAAAGGAAPQRSTATRRNFTDGPGGRYAPR